jgi:predicted NAD/FAD-binding protein
MRRVAVIGSGVSGLAVAHALAGEADVTLFEAGSWFGGHAHTVAVRLEGIRHGVDTGFLVYNERTYPQLISLFEQLGVESALSEMSFSVQAPATGWEWSGSDLNGVFAQRSNLVSPRFWAMLGDVVRFNRLTTGIANRAGDVDAELDEPIGAFLDRHRFGRAFRDGYFLPMIGCIWSCPTDQMLQFPIGTMIRFCHNHGLLQLSNRPQWRTVRGGSKHYVDKLGAAVSDARLATPVREVRRLPPGEGAAGVMVATDHGSERFDEVVLACHSDQSLALLADACAEERAVLGAIRYQPNRAVLHTDTSVLPRRRRAWAAWNYERATDRAQEDARVCLHYLINRLQPLPWQTPVIVSLNPLRSIRPEAVLGEWDYAHPVFDRAAVHAQARVPSLQGRSHVWFCGAWTRYGFHEDGLLSGLAVVRRLRQRWAAQTSGLAA